MSKKIFVSLLALILLLSCGVTAHCAWKWKIPEKWKKAMPGKKSASRILIEVAGKRKELKLGTNPVYIQGPEGDFRIVSYAWGAYSILGYSAPEISEVFCLSGVSGERGYKVDSNFSLIGDVNGDGYKDIASIDSRNRKKLVVFSGRDGLKLRDYTLQQKKYWYGKRHENLATYDHNGDGAEDFFTHTGKNLLLISAKDGNVLKTVIFPTYSSGRINFKLCEIRDMDGDGEKDILLSGGVDIGKDLRQRGIACVYFLSSGTGELLNFTPLKVKFAFDSRDKYMRNIYLEALDVLGDINEDGFPDLVAADRSDGRPKGCSVLLALSGKDGKEIWRVDGSSIKGGGEVHVVDAKTFKEGDTYTDARFGNGLAVYPDINGDGIQEVLAGASQVHNKEIKGWGCLLVFSGKDGSLLKHIWLPEAKGYVGCYIDIFPDIDGDDLPEIMLGVPSSGISAPEGGAVLIVSSKIIN